MKSPLSLAVLLGLMSCSSPSTDAERAYEIVRNAGNAAERCAAAKSVMDAYAKKGDAEQYAEWRSRRSSDCTEALLAKDSFYGDVAPQEREAAKKATDEQYESLKAEVNKIDTSSSAAE